MIVLKKNATLYFYLSPAMQSMIKTLIEKDKRFADVMSVIDFLCVCIKHYLGRFDLTDGSVYEKKRKTKYFMSVINQAKPIKLKDIDTYDRYIYYQRFYKIWGAVSYELEQLGSFESVKKYTILSATDFLNYFTLYCYRDYVKSVGDEEELKIVDKMIKFYEEDILDTEKQIPNI